MPTPVVTEDAVHVFEAEKIVRRKQRLLIVGFHNTPTRNEANVNVSVNQLRSPCVALFSPVAVNTSVTHWLYGLPMRSEF